MESQNGWHEKDTAQTYDEYFKISQVCDGTNRDIIKFGDLSEGMKVVDLGCGTGVTTKRILEVLKTTGHIYAVDISLAMLEVANRQIASENVSFIQAKAENLDEVVALGSIDRVICSSSFWYIQDRVKAFQSIYNVLKNDGKLIFNMPLIYFDIPDAKPTKRMTLNKLMVEVAVEEFSYTLENPNVKKTPLNKEILEDELKNSNLNLEHQEVITYISTPKEAYAFSRMPIITERVLPGVPYEICMKILDRAYEKFEKIPLESYWTYFVVNKKLS